MKRNWKSKGVLLVAMTLLISPARTVAAASVESDWSALTPEQKEEFLLNAKVISSKEIGVGINGTRRATLTDGKLTHDAHVQTVNIHKTQFKTLNGTELNFRDSYKYNIAAYRLDRLLGLNMLPVSVERNVGGDTGSVTWWVDDVMMMEVDRYKKKIQVPPQRNADWNDQMYQVRVFNQLVFNSDPNLGNLLITKEWKIRLSDYSRAFRTQKSLRNPKNLARCDRRIYDALHELNASVLNRGLGDCLRKSEVRGILARRDKILEIFDGKIATSGEASVICDMPGHY